MSQNQDKPTQIAQFMVEFWAKRSSVQNLEKQRSIAEEEIISILLREIEARGKLIVDLQKQLQPAPPVEKLDRVAEEVNPVPPGKELPGRPATQKEIKKAEIVPPQVPTPK